MSTDDRPNSRLQLVRCPACGTHRHGDDAQCRQCDELPVAPQRRSKSRSALIATALLGLSVFPACGDSSTPMDSGPQPAYGIPPIEAGLDAGPTPDVKPDSGADQQLPAPAYGLPPMDAGQ